MLWLKRTAIFSASAAICVAIVITALFTVNPFAPSEAPKEQEAFYVGVAFCGNTSDEAKLLIDKVKDYTNLFVVQSGALQEEVAEMEEICGYAVNSGLDVIVYYGALDFNKGYTQSFLNTAKEQWGDHFLGLYYGDEFGGKMLDSRITLQNDGFGEKVTKSPEGNFVVTKSDGTTIFYEHQLTEVYSITVDYPNGTKLWYLKFENNTQTNLVMLDGPNYSYYQNGTVTMTNETQGNGTIGLGNATVVDKDSAPKVESFEEAWAKRPFQTYDEAAARLVDHCQTVSEWLRNQSVTLFTSDYSLYWYDYLGGYDVVLAQFGWNHTTAQDIALVRGAANLQNKSWGGIITWKYDQEPYLAGGDEIYNQMQMAYESGAKYMVIFNYPTIEGNPYGIMQEEHFQALERFWKDVVQNPDVVQGGVKAEAVLVLPNSYGWGMRNQNDTTWGLWKPDEKSPQVWEKLQSTLETYGPRLDIVYDDPAYPVAGKYAQIFCWNQTG